jgi:hypothetical protein
MVSVITLNGHEKILEKEKLIQRREIAAASKAR